MAQMLITEAQAKLLLKARSLSSSQRKYEKRNIMRQIKAEHGIPASKKIVLFIENPDNPLYRVIRDKRTKLPLDNGIAAPAPAPVVQTSPAVAVKKTEEVKAAAKKAPAAKKPAAKAAPAKKATPAAKKPAAPAKKAAVKVAPAKAAAKKAQTPAKAAPAKKTAKAAPVKVASNKVEYPKQVRITHNNVRVRLGTANSAKEEASMIAKYKKAN